MKNETQNGITKFKTGLPIFHQHCAGIDVGDTLHCVAISDGIDGHEVKTTSGFTSDLEGIVAYLLDHKITTAAMESTGIYWLPLYFLLEQAGIDVYLVNAKHVKNVTGRKKDDTDAIWIQKLHSCGLLQKSFQPTNQMRTLRDYTRQRRNLVTINADSVRRMQKALELMNIKLHTVISDILGKTGTLIVNEILKGERNAEVLSELCDGRIKASRADIIKSLNGIWKEEYLFMLQQAVDHYQFHLQQIKNCDEKIKNQLLKQVAIINDGDVSKIQDPIVKAVKKNELNFNAIQYLVALTAVDLSQIEGLKEASILEFIAEIGIDMTKWKSVKHFAAWLNIAPNSKISGGKILSSKRMNKKNRAGLILKQAAFSISNSKSPLGDYYRKMRAKLGGKAAVVATAHKMARIIYKMLSEKIEYNPTIIQGTQQKYNEQKIKRLESQIEKLKKQAA